MRFAFRKPAFTFAITVALYLLYSGNLFAQTVSVEKLYACKITSYITPLTDSSTVVQVMKPAALPVPIKEKQAGVLYNCNKPNQPLDTAMVGSGKCHLIKGDYYYFGIHLLKGREASEGDLLYLKMKLPVVYDGLLLNVMNHAITFTDVYGKEFMNTGSLFTNSKDDEMRVLDSMVKDIRFTGEAMLQQIPEQNLLIKGGIYDGKKVLDAMQLVTRKELEKFLKYVAARPRLYAGNTWKISEVFATWMTAGTPTVIEN